MSQKQVHRDFCRFFAKHPTDTVCQNCPNNPYQRKARLIYQVLNHQITWEEAKRQCGEDEPGC